MFPSPEQCAVTAHLDRRFTVCSTPSPEPCVATAHLSWYHRPAPRARHHHRCRVARGSPNLLPLCRATSGDRHRDIRAGDDPAHARRHVPRVNTALEVKGISLIF